MSSLETKQKSFQWLIRMRWISIFGVALYLLGTEREIPANPFSGVWAIVLAASLYNLLMNILGNFRRLAGNFILLGFLFDGLIVSWGVSITGGPTSLYIPFYLMVLIAGCLVGSARVALWNALTQWLLFLSTMGACYFRRLPRNWAPQFPDLLSNFLEATEPLARREVYLAETFRWSFFFGLTTLICGLLIRQVWSREERLRVRERVLEQKRHLIQMGELTGRIAHGVNTPLGLILGNLEMLMVQTRKDGKIHKQLSQIEQYVQRAIRAVREILDFGRQSMSEIKPVSFLKIIQAVALSAQTRLKKSGGKLVLDVQPGLPEIQGYPEGLFQVLLNLLENAVDSIGEGGLVTLSAYFQYKTLRLSAQDKRGEIKVVVRDTGKGIPVAELKRIFEPFYSTKGFGKGTGLGLAIVKRIVEEHHGEIKVESRIGEGTVFTLLFPTESPLSNEADSLGKFHYNGALEKEEDSSL